MECILYFGKDSIKILVRRSTNPKGFSSGWTKIGNLGFTSGCWILIGSLGSFPNYDL